MGVLIAIKEKAIISIATSLILGGMTLFYKAIHNEMQEYSELKKSLPQLQQLNNVRLDMENEYKTNKAEVWKEINKIKTTQKRDSAYIYWNYQQIYTWTYGR